VNPPSSVSRAGRPGRRLLALGLLLLLSLALAGVLAFDAIRTADRHRATAERALSDYAGFAAFILASRTYRDLGGAFVATFAAWTPDVRQVAPPRGTACTSGTSYFVAPGGGDLRLHGAPLAPEAVAFLRDTLGNAMALLQEVRWRFRFVRAPAGAADGFVMTSYQVRPGMYAVHGYTVCLGGEDSPFRQTMLAEQALPPALTGLRPADSLFSITVASGSAPLLYASPVRYASPYTGAAALGTEFGDLTLHLALRPDLANRLVIGGVPSSPTPLAVGLLGLSTLLVVVALLQLRREVDLIAMRSEFVANVSHELRTPLSQILIFTELLKLGRLRSDEERARSLEIIDQEARRLIRLVENVLQFSRAGTQPGRLECERLPLADAVNAALDAFRPLAAARAVTLTAAVPPSLTVWANRSAVRQVLVNLLDNAVKFGPRGQAIAIRAEREAHVTRLLVDDQGPGIPLEERERIWGGYYRLAREAQSAAAGSGIGLAVVRSLAEEMGGRAWVTDGDTGGARFVVELRNDGTGAAS